MTDNEPEAEVKKVNEILWHPAEIVRICEEAIVQGYMSQEELHRLLRYVVRLTREGVSIDAQIDCLVDRFGAGAMLKETS